MSLESLLALSRRIALLRLQIRVQMNAAGSLDEQGGSILHGTLGLAMRQAAPRQWQATYGPLEQGVNRPLSLHPPTLPCQWQAGDTITFGLSLLGNLAHDPAAIFASVQQMGQLGLGRDRIGFSLLDICQQGPLGQRLLWSRHVPNQSWAPLTGGLDDALLAAGALCGNGLPNLVQIQTCTRLHIKEQGQPIKTAPSALLLGRTICRRLLNLAGPLAETERLAVLSQLDGLERLRLCWDHTHTDSLYRYSARQRRSHQLEGISGEWAYEGEVIRLVPWLAMGQWLQLGSKTSFGFGSIDWQLAGQA